MNSLFFSSSIPPTECYDMFLWFNTNKTNIKVPRRWNCGARMEFLRFMAFDGGSLILIKFTYMFFISIARWPDSEWCIYGILKKGVGKWIKKKSRWCMWKKNWWKLKFIGGYNSKLSKRIDFWDKINYKLGPALSLRFKYQKHDQNLA